MVDDEGDAGVSGRPSSPSASPPSLLAALLQLSSQQVQQLHAGLLSQSSSPSPDDVATSERLWQESVDALHQQRISAQQSTASSSSSSASAASTSLLSFEALNSAAYTYHQLCHDMPSITVDGVNALNAGLQRHVQLGVLPSAFFSLHLPFLYQLIHQGLMVSTVDAQSKPSSPGTSPSDLATALTSLYATVLFSLLPVVLTSPLPALLAFLSALPTSLASLISDHVHHHEHLHSAVPAPSLDDSLSEPNTPLSPDSDSFTFEADADVSDDDAQQHTDHATGDWPHVEQKLLQLIALWHPPWVSREEHVPATLLRILSLASAHEHLFADTAILRPAIARVLAHAILMRPTILSTYLPPLLSDVLVVPSLVFSSLDPTPATMVPTAASLSGLYLISQLCCSSALPASSHSSVFLFRILRLNLPFFSSHLQWALTDVRDERGNVVNAVLMVVEFFLDRHEGKHNLNVDVGTELVASDLLRPLLAVVPYSHPSLAFACALSGHVAQMCWEERAWRAALEKDAGDEQAVERTLLPVWLALRRVDERAQASPRKSVTEERKEAGGKPALKKGKKLLVAALTDDSTTAEDSVLPPLPSFPPPSPLLPLVERSTRTLSRAIDEAFSSSTASAPYPSLSFLAALISAIHRATSSSPSLSALLQPILSPSPSPTQSPLSRALLSFTALLISLKHSTSTHLTLSKPEPMPAQHEDTEDEHARRHMHARHAHDQRAAHLLSIHQSCKSLFLFTSPSKHD